MQSLRDFLSRLHSTFGTSNMKRIQYLPAAILLSISVGLIASTAKEHAPTNKHTYVIVHGAISGGFAWKKVDEQLTSKGHTVYRPTLTGLGERSHLVSPDTNLSTHIEDIVNVILYESLTDVVLIGHSYGGMVITGVMNQIPDRISRVVFLDAHVPNNGESINKIKAATGDRLWMTLEDGRIASRSLDLSRPPPRGNPQPAGTFTERVSFDNPDAKKLPGTLVLFLEGGGSPESLIGKEDPDSKQRLLMWQRAKERGWNILVLQSGHRAASSHPVELSALLHKIPNEK